MLQRTLFDHHINSIKQKYQRLTQPTQTQSPITQPQYQYSTPVRTHKQDTHNTYQTNPQTQDTPTSKIQQIARKYSCHPKDTTENNQEDRHCLTNRPRSCKIQQIDEFISEKQAILRQRMEQNQRLLRKSKQLRNQESRKNSTHKQTPKQETTSKKQQSPTKENYTSVLAEKKTTLIKRQVVGHHRTRSQLQQVTEKARQVFAQKINQVIGESLKSKEFTLFSDKKQPIRRNQKLATNLISFTKMQTQNQGEEKKQLKLMTVFEDTSKIQERIKVLLSTH